MKRILTLLLCVLTLALAAPAEQRIDDKKADVHAVIDKTTHDFGNLRAGSGEAKCTFTLRNTGREPLIIVSATASCGCTRPHFTAKPIMPGKEGTVEVTYRPNGRGEIDQNVKLRLRSASEPGKSKRVTLRITGVVLPEE